MFIKNIARILEGLIYILLGVVAATIIITFFVSLPANSLLEEIKEIIEASLVVILLLLPLPTILNKYANSSNNNLLSKTVYTLKNMQIALGILFIALRILHVRINILFEPVKWNMETITSILLFIFLVPTVIYGILRINDSEKYRKPHRFFLVLTYFIFIAHLFH